MDFERMTLIDLIAKAEEAKKLRQRQCEWSAKSYLRKCARENGMTVEEYVEAKKRSRGAKLRHFPAGFNDAHRVAQPTQ